MVRFQDRPFSRIRGRGEARRRHGRAVSRLKATPQYWFGVAAVAVAAAYAFWFGFRAWRKNRLIEDTPVSRVRSAVQGYVELRGRGAASPQNPIKSPLTHKSCAWWRYEIQEWRRSGKSKRWVTIEEGTSEMPFVLDDGTGQCLVDPRGAEVVAPTTDIWCGDSRYPGVRLPAATGVLGWLEAQLVTPPYRYIERRLESGRYLCAIGAFRTGGGVRSFDADAAAGALLHDWKNDQPGLLARFDTNHDGVIGAAEWESARAAAAAQVSAQHLAAPIAPSSSVLAAPGDGRPFLLTATDRDALARRFRLQAAASLGLFLAATTAVALLLKAV
jgi:hypothetical protein